MEVRCDKCQARYRVDDARVGPQGLTMRCGKCQNTFKVMRPAANSPATAAAAPRPSAAPKAPAPRPADEGAGRTMMFQTAPLKPPQGATTAAVPTPPKPQPKGEPQSGSTMIFGKPPAGANAAAPAASASPQPGNGAGSTRLFSSSPAAQKPIAPPRSPALATQPDAAPRAEREPHRGAGDIGESAAGAPAAASHAEAAARNGHPGVQAEGAEDLAPRPGAFDRAPPKGLLIAVAAGLLLLLVGGGGLVVWKKTARRPPPAAAVETLGSAQSDADKDTLPSIAAAETKARDALEVAGPRARFPEAAATLASIEVQWADALNDQAAAIGAKDPNDPRVGTLQAQAKAKLKSAFDALSPALKADSRSPDLQLALADYHRAQRSNSRMNKALRDSGMRDDPRAAAIQGMAAAQEEDGAERAIPKLKAAAAGAPQSARLRYRLAQAYAAIKDDAGARAELQETLKISPQHERARLLLEQLAPQASTGSNQEKR